MVVGLEVLKKVFKGVNVLNSEAKVIFSEDGFKVYTVEPGNVALVQAEIPKNACEAYTLDNEIEVGLDIKDALNILKIGRSKDLVDFVLDEQTAKFRFGKTEYTTATYHTFDTKKFNFDSLDLPAKIKVSGEDFKRGVQVADQVGKDVLFLADGETFIMESKGNVDRVKIDFKDVLIDYNKEKAKSRYSLEYLKAMVSVLKAMDVVEIRMGDNLPLKLGFLSDECSLMYVLAPIVVEEED